MTTRRAVDLGELAPLRYGIAETRKGRRGERLVALFVDERGRDAYLAHLRIVSRRHGIQ